MDKKTHKEVEDYFQSHVSFLKKKFNPLKLILFGSRARGDYLDESDFDLLVVSDQFKEIDFLDRICLAYGLWKLRQGLDVLCYTPEEFEIKKKQIGIVQEAVKEGIDL